LELYEGDDARAIRSERGGAQRGARKGNSVRLKVWLAKDGATGAAKEGARIDVYGIEQRVVEDDVELKRPEIRGAID
jgi:hypothetical protein